MGIEEELQQLFGGVCGLKSATPAEHIPENAEEVDLGLQVVLVLPDEAEASKPSLLELILSHQELHSALLLMSTNRLPWMQLGSIECMDQGVQLMLIGLGKHLRLWDLDIGANPGMGDIYLVELCEELAIS